MRVQLLSVYYLTPGKRLNRILESPLSHSSEATGIFPQTFPVLPGSPGEIVFPTGSQVGGVDSSGIVNWILDPQNLILILSV